MLQFFSFRDKMNPLTDLIINKSKYGRKRGNDYYDALFRKQRTFNNIL